MKAIVSRHEDTWNKTPYLISGKKKKKIYGSLHFLMERQMILMKKDVDYRSKIWGIENE